MSECEFTRLFGYLAVQYPQAMADLIERTLAEAVDGGAYAALPHDAREILHRLPAVQKTALWRRFSDQARAKHLLLGQLTGTDVDWVRELLDAGTNQFWTPSSRCWRHTPMSAFRPWPGQASTSSSTLATRQQPWSGNSASAAIAKRGFHSVRRRFVTSGSRPRFWWCPGPCRRA